MRLTPAATMIKQCLRAGWASLLLGTALLVLFFFGNDPMVAFLSAPVVLILSLHNLKLLLQLLWRAHLEKENRWALW